ncbi:bifunctional [glutamate--ammonia ligase]-adenylyl-L-tyrosine phosphorylase/[glutamate--ammonia-ligase] adenylyltransferase [Thiobacillus sp.]|uniref:bifunctional [glutamate--ammonia ligase]-adenylyl-L-tyrosine phosphorylase/[glutamate--ammonia-ligase] adenylyltransferase n=1 Tax=Thiobacillus sp. TaxID=924 RepID=UPI0011DBF5B1|nr:bifunctional [glutamate--ammonia ligase]-adenylyl-L-tyrosine phosphorylase/[glutamate--ammonia-ligase] adenylyltransferase [Thiobacillus sp.]TXH72692.1 MAG: bifunctional [glutamate--ammonia ligase]-adenylyl-L-tyrosine phosphorylase/[glutamate--ammonia-ligase] adenylyltransferase [Thiobacillus sp.]
MSHPALERVARCSRYGRRLLTAQPNLAETVAGQLGQAFGRAAMQAFLAEPACADEAALHQRLRQLRQRVWLIVTARDLAGQADLAEVMATYSTLAEVCIAAALDFHHAGLAARHGEPRDENGIPQQMVVVGMGKLGGGELNVSSDIDLIYLYPEEGDTAADDPSASIRPLSNHEFFIRLGRKLAAALGENTADGYVFRVDLRLRPWGESGPFAMGYAMLEDYLVAQGRPWERYAWIKARPLTGSRHDELMQIVRPFVFRKYLDFGAFAAIRDLHVQIRREVARREMAHNVKLGPGGIREIEFTAQVFQLIRGGQIAALQQQPTLVVLDALVKTGLMTADAQQELAAAYDFLRRLEHRIQYLDDAQTQLLPDDAESQAMLAEAMGFPDYAAMLTALDRHRNKVTRHFEQVFAAPQTDQNSHPLTAVCCGTADADATQALLENAGYDDPPRVLATLDALRQNTARLPESTQLRLNALLPPALEVIGSQADPAVTLERFAALIQSVSRRATYLALLAEYPAALRQLVRLLAASPWAAQMITRQPQLLDELIAPQHLMSTPDWTQLAALLHAELDAHPGDTEAQMDALRRFKQVQTLHLLAQDVAGRLTLEALSDHLSYLADTLLNETLARCWAGLKTRHRDTPRFAIVGYGKLGGKELGYASDLDLVFLYEDDAPQAQEIYARLAQRINTWLGTLTSTGILYETDLRLRPDGASGLLVSSTGAFRDYQLHHAWVWEHQALTRARFVCGDAAIGASFEALRREVLGAPRDAGKLRDDVLSMREKMHAGHVNDSDLFDLKHDHGGIVDVEFCVQYLVLRDCAKHPELADNVGNIALLQRASAAGLIPATLAQAAADAYRELRSRQHAIKLSGAEYARVPPQALESVRNAVSALWTQVMDTAA